MDKKSPSKVRRIIAVTALVLIALVGWQAWLRFSDPLSFAATWASKRPSASQRSEVIASRTARTDAPRTVFAPRVGAEHEQRPRVELARDNPHLAALYDRNRAAALRRLLDDGSAPAFLVAQDIYMRCVSLVIPGVYDGMIRQMKEQAATPDVRSKQTAVLAQLQAECDGITQDDAARLDALRAARRGTLGAIGDLNGRIRGSKSLDDVKAHIGMIRDAATYEDPLVILDLGNTVMSLMGDVLRRKGETTIDFGDGLAVTTRGVQMAFWLASCEYGGDCGPSSTLLTYQCLRAARCDMISIEDYTQFIMTQPERDALPRARDAVLQGLRTGNWPPGLRGLLGDASIPELMNSWRKK